MAKYRDAVCKLCRRDEMKLFLKGERCYTTKCAFERRAYAPGVHGQKAHRKATGYLLQLREKQKVKRTYGLLERQFRNYYLKAAMRKGITGEILLQLLERRLDNIVYRAGFALSRAQARQLVRHGHFMVNERKVNIPSFMLRPGDRISVRDKSRKLDVITQSIAEIKKGRELPWLSLDKEKFQATLLEIPKREAIPTPASEQLIVELYSK